MSDLKQIIEGSKLTGGEAWLEVHRPGREPSRILARSIADAAHAKAWQAFVAMLKSDLFEARSLEDNFGYGGPRSCEYGCLWGSGDLIHAALAELGIAQPEGDE